MIGRPVSQLARQAALSVVAAVLALTSLPAVIAAPSLEPSLHAAVIATTPVTNSQPTVYWVDPVKGKDSNSGNSRSAAFKSLIKAWQMVPANRSLLNPITINLVRGTYSASLIPVYMEKRHGSSAARITIKSVDGRDQAVLLAGLNIFDVRHLDLVGLAIAPQAAAFHCEKCRHVTIRRSTLSGGDQQAHETVKANQSRNINIIDSDISGAADNAIDFVAVVGGVIRGNRIHNANDWCIYVKGGSARIRIESNEIYDCGTGGFTAGQGTGFEFMSTPYLTYEAEDILFQGNAIHDTDGAGMGVNGGRNIILQNNVLTRIGQRSHLLEISFGGRGCDGDLAACQRNLDLGGWGTLANEWDDGIAIPNLNVQVLNNTFTNPIGYQTAWQHFEIPGPRTNPAGGNAPTTARADTGLVIQGNTIQNGTASMSLGLDDSTGCRPTNPTCNETQLRAENTFIAAK